MYNIKKFSNSWELIVMRTINSYKAVLPFNSQQTWKYTCRQQWKHDNLINNKNGDIQSLYDFHISTCHKKIGVICSRGWLINLISPLVYENVFLSSHPRTINPQHPSPPITQCKDVQINILAAWILLKKRTKFCSLEWIFDLVHDLNIPKNLLLTLAAFRNVHMDS